MSDTFNFCRESRVVTEIPPESSSGMTMNGWMFSSKPKIPYRPSFTVKLYGLRWRLTPEGTGLDIVTEPDTNAGKLRLFYIEHELWRPFTFNHEYLGPIYCKFQKPVTIPAGIGNSNGLIEAFDVSLIEHNPRWR